MSSFKKLFLTPARSKKAATRPSSMRSYKVESALSMGLEQQGPDLQAAVESVRQAVRQGTERDRSSRVQQQWVISLVLSIAMLALLAGLYLNITASASIAGRQIQSLEADIIGHEQVNADLETRIATLMANSVLEKRAEALGFAPVERKDIQYMIVPGYFPPQPVNMVSTVSTSEALATNPEYTETLIDWFIRQIETASIPLAQSKRP